MTIIQLINFTSMVSSFYPLSPSILRFKKGEKSTSWTKGHALTNCAFLLLFDMAATAVHSKEPRSVMLPI